MNKDTNTGEYQKFIYVNNYGNKVYSGVWQRIPVTYKGIDPSREFSIEMDDGGHGELQFYPNNPYNSTNATIEIIHAVGYLD